MTAKRKRHVVADDVLGQVSRKTFDLTRRILEGGTDTKRAEFFLQRALEGVREPNYASQGTHGVYILESHWAWDNSHYEFATFALEKCDWKICCEDLLKIVGVSRTDKDELLEHIRGIHDAQCTSSCPKPNMIRLYRVLDSNYFGIDPSRNLGRDIEGKTADIHFSLLPLCDFDKDGKPIPCNYTK